MAERFYKRREVRERLKISKRTYDALIETGFLAKPIRLKPNSHPFHTESQILAAERKIRAGANPDSAERNEPIISDKLFKEIQETYVQR
jgi:hypothetical protein